MRSLRRFWRRFLASFSMGRHDREFAQELESHRRMLVDENIRQGMSPGEARRAASLTLGGVEALKDAQRDQRGLPLLDSLPRDLRFAARALRRRPMFTAVCVLTLGLAIGANVAIFSLIDRVLLQPLSVRDAGSLVTVERTGTNPRGVPLTRTDVSWREAEAIREMRSFSEMALSSTRYPLNRQFTLERGAGDAAESITVRFVTANFFDVLGIAPVSGRSFHATDDTAAAPPVALLSHAFWQSRFGGERAGVGRPIVINGSPVTVVGVVPATFAGIELGIDPPDVYVTMAAARSIVDDEFIDSQSGSPIRGVIAVGRLRAGDEARAQTELELVLARTWNQPVPAPGNGRVTVAPAGKARLVPLVDTMLPFESRDDIRRFLGLLGAAVALTLLIGCANLAGLLLARAEERRADLAVRAALGASRWRLLRELGAEAGLITIAGGAAALVVARWLEAGLSAFTLPGAIAVSSLREPAGARTLVFAALATLAAAVVISVAPALRVASRQLAVGISSRSVSMRLGLTRILVGAQVAVCVVLVFGATLFVRTLSNALSLDLGFDSRDLVSVQLTVASSSGARGLVSSEAFRGIGTLDDLADRLSGTSSITAATVGPLPLVRGADGVQRNVDIDSIPTDLAAPVDVVYAAANYFTTLGQRIVRGRDFQNNDRDGALRVAIVNEAAARQFWPNGDALGHRIRLPFSRDKASQYPELTVIGIVRNVKLRTLRESEPPIIYLARRQNEAYLAGYLAGAGNTFLIVRSPSSTADTIAIVRRAAADAGVVVQKATTLQQAVDEMLMPQRLGRALLLLLGGVALALTLAGIYGLVSYLVARNTKEIGVKLALGAGTREIVRSLAVTTAAPMACGVLGGSIIALYGGRFADRFLYGMTGSDPLTMVIVAGLVVAFGTLAALLPTRRALSINPIDTLRAE